MQFTTKKLVEETARFPEMVEIVNVVREVRNLEPNQPEERLESYSRRGDMVTVMEDDGKLVGFVLINPADITLGGNEFLPFKIWAAKNEYNMANMAVPHFVYVHPDYWSGGHTTQLSNTMESETPWSYVVYHSFATKVLEDWGRNRPNAIDTGILGPAGDPIFIRNTL